ncbi:MAG: hypothetical protein HUK40_11285 [Desulfobacter sp.]|nr:hypothetical protein [Desulfobacter sp.]WDP84079.1 MAG: hypothetical protein HUN05_01985 [Desulfobacter sp.]
MKQKGLTGIGGIFLVLWILASGTAFAADWNFYGNARVQTFYEDVDTGSASSTNLSHSLQSNSRIGANVKVSDELVGRFEYGASGGNANIRHLYGEWHFGSGKLLIGQTDSPLNFALSNQVYGTDAGMDPYGHVDAKRQPMLQLTFGNFKVAAVQPDTGDLGLANSSQEVKLPKIEAKYRLDLKSGYLELAGGYQTYELTDTSSLRTYDVDSYILALGGQVRLGSAYLGGDIWTGQNVGPYDFNCSPDGDPQVVAGTLEDNDAYGVMVAAGFMLNERFSFEAGYGYVAAEIDHLNYAKDDTVAYYLQSTVTLAPGVFFVPEVGRIDKDRDKDGVEEADTVYAGVKWQINF